MSAVRSVCFYLVLLLAIAGSGCAAQAAGGISKLGYTVQVGAFSEVRNAERLTARLQDKGIDAFYFKRENGLFAVRFGDFASRVEARRHAQRIADEHGLSSFFIAPPAKVSLAPRQEPPRPGSSAAPAVKKPGRDDLGFIAARTAERFVGIPYQWGGNTVVDGMDCSGFARAVYNLCGVNIPRTSAEQFKVGRSVVPAELVDGDLVFFGSSDQHITHVGIYVGDNRFVHAPRRGEDIRVSSLQEGAYARKYVGARRYF
jgi:gamma-D-glutamyl-L-lysine dipeptidyl-peptidase